MRSAIDPTPWALLLALSTGCTPVEDDDNRVECTPLDGPVLDACTEGEPLPPLEGEQWDSVVEEWNGAVSVERFAATGRRQIRTLYLRADSAEDLAAIDGECIVVNDLWVENSDLENLDALRHFDVREYINVSDTVSRLSRVDLPSVQSLRGLSISAEVDGLLARVALPNLRHLDDLLIPESVCDLDLGAMQGAACGDEDLPRICPSEALRRRTCCDGIFDGTDEGVRP